MKHIRAHLLFYILVPLSVFAVVASFYRFMVTADYIVEYEGVCDPYTQSCYIGCEDDECLSTYYYALIKRPAADAHAVCGPDITDCAEASTCDPTDAQCSIMYCSSDTVLDDELCDGLGPANNTETQEIEAVDKNDEPIL